MNKFLTWLILAVGVGCLAVGSGGQAQEVGSTSASTQAPLTLTLQDALKRANSVPFQAALTDQGVAHQDKVQARAVLLPKVSYQNQFIYTQPAEGPTGSANPGSTAASAQAPRFIANNSVHEYLSEGVAEESLGYAQVADYRKAKALESVARARAEIASRGLVLTVVQNYYGFIAAQRKFASVQLAATEAENFLNLSRKLESGGEVAHSDVIKAQIQFNDRQRDLREAQLAMDKARLELAVLLFPNFNQNFSVVDDSELAPPLESFDEFARMAQTRSPDVRASASALEAAGYELSSVRGEYLPSLTLNYFYGIDAPQFAARAPDGTRNLGYAATATLNIPVWNWGATHSKAVQADLKRKQAQRELSLAQRKLLADMRSLYAEAAAARDELAILKQSADLAAESLRLTTLRYQGGEATVLEVVDAQNTLTQARNAYSDGVVRYRSALANLQTLTGTM
ncbi:MAG TPA: TolC family protein [Candidatus Acidoferrales bacterium]|nr:TolC family protein [Candidatus Acidoferrales bacterium]